MVYNYTVGIVIKFLLFLLIIAVIGYFVIDQIPSLKERVIEAINPAAKEARLLGKLKVNLDELSKNLDEAEKQKSSADVKSGIKNGQSLLGKSQGLMEEILKINGETGIIGSQIGKIINAFSDQTPYPADHLQAPQTSTSSASCTPK